MDPNLEAQRTGFLIGLLIGGALVGAIGGLITLAVGRSRDRIGLGWTGFGLCLVAGLLFGLFGAVPMTVIMSVVILVVGPAKKKKTQQADPYSRMRIPTGLPDDL